MVFLGRILKNVSLEGQVVENRECDSGEDSEDNQTKLSLLWMIRRMRKIVNIEIVHAPKSTAMVRYTYSLILSVQIKFALKSPHQHHCLEIAAYSRIQVDWCYCPGSGA